MIKSFNIVWKRIYGPRRSRVKNQNRLLWSFCLFITGIIISCSSYADAPTIIGNRTITFVNNCSFPVWFGLSSGSVQNTHPAFPGDTSCVSGSDCYAGSSCIQTGNIKQCFWIPPQPADNNYQLNAQGGTNSVSIPIYANTQNVIWSGAVAGRTNCASGACATADCGTGTGGCRAGTGFQQPATQAEFTLLSTSADFYDVEIINGVNIPVQMSPNLSVSSTSSAPYTCGSPGAATASNTQLGACTWELNPPSNDYRWVTKGGTSCSVDSDCQSPSVCGISFNSGKNPLLQKSCGSLLGYWTADQVCGVQSNYGEPFNCTQKLPAPQNNLTLWNLYACTNVGSCYSAGAGTNCCGCVNWDKAGIQVPGAPATKQCANTNPNWNNYVEPTLAWLKKACPTAYVYPFDDMSSTFTCSQMQNKVNVVNYTITYCPNGQVTPPSQQAYAYTVYVGSPFSPVLINSSITCPNPKNDSPACLVSNQIEGQHITIKGSGSHLCDLTIQPQGGIVINSNSNGCNINSTPATPAKAGVINLPSKF
jgi:hypothetical protein